jgi:hypothetical protein
VSNSALTERMESDPHPNLLPESFIELVMILDGYSIVGGS